MQNALERLKSGNNNFCNNSSQGKRRDGNRRKELVEGQSPFAIILSCSDSRVVPELIFDAGLGELFVVRVAGNVANPSSVASVEYAVKHLGAKLVVVMGHEGCGMMTAAIAGGDGGKNLNHLLDFIRPAVSAGNKTVAPVTRINCQLAAKAMSEASDIIGRAVQKGDVQIVTGYYNLASGRVDFNDGLT